MHLYIFTCVLLTLRSISLSVVTSRVFPALRGTAEKQKKFRVTFGQKNVRHCVYARTKKKKKKEKKKKKILVTF